ncbi:hypothetical protein HMI49_24085 [Corallococcus exercitus]|uniref:Glycosyltransferase RgtA/B/C/D-like domain-containing protein n=1 Tax=Corallococcus exercitus TaxID=2316736 RepID=A0A7Y4KLZ5_9BACT|nr:hypothetical protein [Corallococcus exercitus]NOK36288.1 hypothetical protein [Corallococcus exercitus]
MSRTRLLALLVALVAVLVAVWQRAHAVERLGQDFDEATYLPIAFTYAGMMEQGRWGDIGKLRENFEHPPLVKLLFAQAVRVTGAPEPDWSNVPMGQPIPDAARPVFRATRSLSAVAGVLQVGLVALVDPLGALLLAWDPYHTKYTSQAYLEAVPGLLAVLALLAFERARRKGFSPGWTAVSGALLGLAAAGKYPYGLVGGLTFLPFLVAGARTRWRPWAAIVVSTAAAFILVNPALWSSPFALLWESITFHWDYSHNEHVRRAALPWYQPLAFLTDNWLSASDPGIYLTHFNARALLPLAVVGLPRTWRERPVWAVGAVVGLVFLLLWNTKWPQYLLLVLPALCVCAGGGVRTVASGAVRLYRKVQGSRSRVSAGV